MTSESRIGGRSRDSVRSTSRRARAAAQVLCNYLQPSPLRLEPALSERLGCEVFARYEFENPVRSFKIRGALNLLSHLSAASEEKPARLVTASTGNHGAAMAFACREFSMPLIVGVPVDCDRSKVALIRHYGPELRFVGRDIDETKEILLEDLAEDSLFIEDGSRPEIYDGTATIGLEISQSLPEVEYVFVPVGNGALIGGIGAVLKEFNPRIRIIGVQSERAPCMALSFRAGEPVDTPECNSFAGGMAVRVAIPEAVEVMLEVVDDMVLVSEQALKRAVGGFYKATGHLVEGAGAAALAAALEARDSIRGRRICLIATGANVDEELKQEILRDFV